MNCPICSTVIPVSLALSRLPRFIRCPNCTGYITMEKEIANYPTSYFTEAPEKSQRNIFSPLLNFFLWLRFRKIACVLGGKKERILDYGCGNGKLIVYLRGKGLSVEGYDPEPSAIALARRRGLSVFGSIVDTPYDLVMLWHSLEHTETPLKEIEAITKHLSPEGRVLIAVPNGDCLEARLARESWFCYDWPFHRVHFTPKALTILLHKTGFRILSVSHLNLEYTVSSLVQTFLNLFLPKNALYNFVATRRSAVDTVTLSAYSAASLVILIIFSPILLLFFIVAVVTHRTAAFIVVAQKI